MYGFLQNRRSTEDQSITRAVALIDIAMIVPAVTAVERNGRSILTPLEVMLLAAIVAAGFVAVERLVPMIAGTLSHPPCNEIDRRPRVQSSIPKTALPLSPPYDP